MTLLLCIGSVIFALAGIIVFGAARGAVHETASIVLFLTSAVLLVGATLNNAANRLIDLLNARLPSTTPAAPKEDKQSDVVPTPNVDELPAQLVHEAPPAAPPAAPKSWVDLAKEEIRADKS